MTQAKHHHVHSRNEAFAKRTKTRIWQEHACDDNPYIAASALCHGYNLYDLMKHCSFIEVFYLLFRGELPDNHQTELLETLMVALINPGPRHAATRAAMNAGVGKTLAVHILPIASTVLGGNHLGGADVEACMRFLIKHQEQHPVALAQCLLDRQARDAQTDDQQAIAPGFNQYYGGIDIMTTEIARQLSALPAAGKTLQWGMQFSNALHQASAGWLRTGLAAAVFCDLGFQPRAGGPLFQLLGAPGLIAHGLELANKPFTAMPYIGDDNYVIEN
ncbi:MAG: citrate synthase [Cellvibrionaceae bacterium]|nr:citrate synthase [Cellvibrionaceae bacterium]